MRRIVLFVVAVAALVAAGVLLRGRTGQEGSTATQERGEARASSSAGQRESVSARSPATGIGRLPFRIRPRPDELEATTRGREVIIRRYERFATATALTDQQDSEVRRILFDAQVNLAILSRDRARAITETGEPPSTPRDFIQEFDGEYEARLAEVLDGDQLRSYKEIIGSTYALAAMEPFEGADVSELNRP